MKIQSYLVTQEEIIALLNLIIVFVRLTRSVWEYLLLTQRKTKSEAIMKVYLRGKHTALPLCRLLIL